MKHRTIILATLLAAAGLSGLAALGPAELDASIQVGAQSTLKLVLGGKVIYVDPIQVSADKADIILLTHPHDDHADSSSVKRLGKNATVIAPFSWTGGKLLAPGSSMTLHGITITAVPAYNGKHPKAANWAGFLIGWGGVTVYVAGDTGRMAEMKTFKADIAIVPLGQTYTMASVDDAVASVLDVGATIAHPYHYGMYEGSDADAAAFLKKLNAKGVKASLLKALAP